MPERIRIPRWRFPHLARGLVPATAVAIGLVTLFVIPRPGLGSTSHAGASLPAGLAHAAAGLSMVAAGLAWWLVRPARWSAGFAASLAGVTWFASEWVGWVEAPPLLRSAAMAIEPLFLAFVAHLLLSPSVTRPRSRGTRALVATVYTWAAVVSAGRALFRDPFLDPYCWSNCRDNVFVIVSRPDLARALDTAWLLGTVLVGLLFVASATWRLVTSTGPARRALLPVQVPGLVLGAASAGYVLALARQRLESPEDVFALLFQLRAWSTAAIAVGVVVVLARAWRTRVALARLTAELDVAPRPGTLRQALADATGDASLEVVYPISGLHGRYIDAAGNTVTPPQTGNGRVVTPIVSGGEEIAVVDHDAASVDADQLHRELGAAARLALENDRLHAQLLAELEDLRASRSRAVEAGDSERRRLERNLHDGAQQRLLALLFDVRLARSAADAKVATRLAELLATAEEEARLAVADLRDLARGIYPAVLTESGLAGALYSLSDTAPLPVHIGEVVDERFPEPIERTAFVVASEAIDAAQRHDADGVTLRACLSGDRLVLDIEGAPPGRYLQAQDRVGALGGTLSMKHRSLRVELPCA